MILDMLSHEYGWTTEYILSRTFREVDFRIRAMIKRHGNDVRLQASLHGLEIKNDSTIHGESVELTQEQKKLMHDASLKAIERKSKRGNG